MAINSQIATVADSIAGLSISGVTIKDIDQIPDSAKLLCPLLIPQPNDYVTNLTYTRQSFGSMGAEKLDCTYSLNYIYLHCELGSGLGAYAPYAGIISKLELILETVMSNDTITGAVDIQVGNIGSIGVINDPAGNQYWGVIFSLNVLEHSQ